MGTSTKLLREKLQQLAQTQGGYFTALQARTLGYNDEVHSYHVRRGHWIRKDWGIYRLCEIPETSESRLFYYLLWSRNKRGKPQGIFVGVAAVAILNGDTDLIHDSVIEMAVPMSFRKRNVPQGLRIKFEDLSKIKKLIVRGLPIALGTQE